MNPRVVISQLRTTAISIRRFASLLYRELDSINERIDAIEKIVSKKNSKKNKEEL